MYDKAVNSKSFDTRFDGFYRAIVIDNNDPKEAGRVKVKVFPMFNGVSNSDLPWAIPADPSFGGISNRGSINVPDINSHVFVFFENGDHRFPVYFAGAPAIENGEPDVPTLSRKDDGTVQSINSNLSSNVPTASGGSWNEPSSAYNPSYPNNRVFRSKNGVIIEIDDTDGNVRFHIYHPSGTRTEIDNSGNKVEHVNATKTTVVVGDDNIEVKGKHDMTVNGTWGVRILSSGKIVADGTIDITAPTINLN